MDKPKGYLSLIILAIIAFLGGYFLSPHREAVFIPDQLPAHGNVVPLSVVAVHETASTSADIQIEYPQFISVAPEFSNLIASSVAQRLADFNDAVTDNQSARALPMNTYSFIATWEPVQINAHYISFVIHFGTYTGGANGMQDVETYNYDLMAHREVTLADLFPADKDYLTTVSTAVRKDLSVSLRAASPGYQPEEQLNPGTTPKLENFRNFAFDRNTITFYFPKYAVAPGAFGEQKASMPLP